MAAVMQTNRSGPVDLKLKKMMPFPICGVHHLRNNPQPSYMKHFIGLDNMSICNVRCDHEDHSLPPTTPIIDPLKRLNLRNIPYKERAVPHFGMIPVSEPWRGELMNLTESVLFSIWNDHQILPQVEVTDMRPLPVRRPLTSWMIKNPLQADLRPSVQMSQHFSRPETRMSQLCKRENASLPNIEKSKTPNTPSESKLHDLQYVHAHLDGVDFEAQVFALLCQILNLKNLSSVQKWLLCSSGQDKVRVVQIIKDIFTTRANNEENSLTPIQEETDEDKCETNVLTLEDQPMTQSTRSFHMAQNRPVSSIHSPYIYRPSSVANKRLISSVPSTSRTQAEDKQHEKSQEPVRLRLSTGVSRSSSFQASYSDNMMHRNVAITADGYSRPPDEISTEPSGKFFGLKNIV